MNDALLNGGAVGLGLGTVVVALVVFLVIRWFWLWYWRVNKIVGLLERIAEGVERQPIATATWRSPAGWRPTPPPVAPAPKGWRDRVLDRVAGVP